ncbi:MAG: 4-oxalomesaconate tautomerase [Granulosicoccus sp.]
MQTAIPATLMRGGTSRGVFFHASDLPVGVDLRNQVLLALMGSPDLRQIDGVGGAHPLTSKVAVLSPPTRSDADIDYLFLQVSVDKAQVSDGQNCGNILAGVGPWAIENGYVAATGDTTAIRIHMCNSNSMVVATVNTPNGVVDYTGEARIDGVPGTAAPVSLEFLDVAGATCGALLPTGNAVDVVDGIDVTCIDNGMPVVVMRAADLGKSGYETPAELEADAALKERVEAIRLAVAKRMNLGVVSDKTVPKMCLIAAPVAGGSVCTRSFIPQRVHDAIGVLAAVSVATVCLLPGSVAAGIANVASSATNSDTSMSIQVEHPSGFFTVSLSMETTKDTIRVRRSALLRTARKLFRGEVYVPSHVWDGENREIHHDH